MTLKEKYNKEVVPALMSKYGYKSIMEVPKLEKVVINVRLRLQTVWVMSLSVTFGD